VFPRPVDPAVGQNEPLLFSRGALRLVRGIQFPQQ
jgi:hypothetical protein